MTVNRLKISKLLHLQRVFSNLIVPGSVLPTPHSNTGLWKVNDSFRNKGSGGRVPGLNLLTVQFSAASPLLSAEASQRFFSKVCNLLYYS